MHLIVFGYDDWHGLYKDGELVFEGHSVPIFELIDTAKGEPFTLEEPSVDEDRWNEWIESQGGLPQKYDNIPKEVFTT